MPCLITIGSIMDFEGHVIQVSATFTPLQQVEAKQSVMENNTHQQPANVNILKFIT